MSVERARTVTIADVARAAQVSTATVSLVVNGQAASLRISEATRQVRRRVTRHVIEPEPEKERSRLSHWPPDRWVQWRIETLTPWKLKSWKFRNWG